MLTDPEEIALVQNAMEPGIRLADRPANGLTAIVRDFMHGRSFKGETVLELGPGHYEFCEMVREGGGRTAVVELDPVIAELGRRRGHTVHVLDLRALPQLDPGTRYDGLFGKGSNNPFWCYGDEAALRAYTQKLIDLTTPSGWIWIASCPYTDRPITPAQFTDWLEVERRIYLTLGFKEWLVPSRRMGSIYGISVPCDGLRVFTRNLPTHRWTLATALATAVQIVKRLAKKILGR